MKRILLYQHAGSYNHGCEAIVKSIIKIMGQENYEFILCSQSMNEDVKFFNKDEYHNLKIFQGCNYIFNSKKITEIYNGIMGRIFSRIPFLSLQYKKTINVAKNCDIAISIGGDIYSYGKSVIACCIDEKIRKYAKKTIIWGCSINSEYLKENKNKLKIKNLKSFDLIITRESITYSSLKDLNLKNIILLPDPAFVLDVANTKIKSKKLIGINVSDLICKKNKNIFIILTEIINYIMNSTDYDIVLIPHVTWLNNNDELAQQKLYNFLDNKTKKRVTLIEACDCRKLKSIISKCDMLITGRTHASIAAYSTLVPTLVIGYSVKSKGIAKDIFNSYENYVVSTEMLNDQQKVLSIFKEMFTRKSQIKKNMETIIPNYIKKAYSAKEVIEELLK